MEAIQLAIFDFDGTLFNTQQAILLSLQKTFESLLPDSIPQESHLVSLIGSGKGLEDTIRALHPDPSTLDQAHWIAQYRQFYATIGQGLIRPYDGVEQLLKALKARDVPVAVVTNKSVAAVEASLNHFHLSHLVDSVVGDTTPGATRKPKPESYTDVLLPALESRLGKTVDVANVVVIGDTEADLKFAINIGGAKSVWCRYGFGDPQHCQPCNPTHTVDSVDEIRQLFG